jgi:hypothetical protein
MGDAALYLGLDCLHCDIIQLFRRSCLPDHGRTREPREEYSSWRRSAINLIVKPPETGHDFGVIGYFRARQRPYGGLEYNLNSRKSMSAVVPE